MINILNFYNLIRSEGQGLFSTFFPFMSNDLAINKGPSAEDIEATKEAQNCVDECHIEQLIHDTKFLRVDSLLELIKALMFHSHMNEGDLNSSLNNSQSGTSTTSSSNLMNNGNVSGQTNASSAAGNNSMNSDLKIDNDAAVFSLEILVKVVLQNRYLFNFLSFLFKF